MVLYTLVLTLQKRHKMIYNYENPLGHISHKQLEHICTFFLLGPGVRYKVVVHFIDP